MDVIIGIPFSVASKTPDGSLGVVFDDNGKTGYFFAHDYRPEETRLLDALHVYNIEEPPSSSPTELKIIWSEGFQAAAVILDQKPQVVFHFEQETGYANDPFPDPPENSSWIHAPFHKSLKNLFYTSSQTQSAPA